MALLTGDRLRVVRRLLGAEVRVFLGHEDVTARCVAADDEHGWAVLWVVDAAGVADLFRGDVSFVWRVQQKRHVWQWVNLRLAPTPAETTSDRGSGPGDPAGVRARTPAGNLRVREGWG